MDFSTALEHIKNNNRVTRSGWNGKEMFLFLVGEGTMSHPLLEKETVAQPYIAIRSAQGTVFPWFASQADLLADDWAIFPVRDIGDSISGIN
jgi:hypothetical protein